MHGTDGGPAAGHAIVLAVTCDFLIFYKSLPIVTGIQQHCISIESDIGARPHD